MFRDRKEYFHNEGIMTRSQMLLLGDCGFFQYPNHNRAAFVNFFTAAVILRTKTFSFAPMDTIHKGVEFACTVTS